MTNTQLLQNTVLDTNERICHCFRSKQMRRNKAFWLIIAIVTTDLLNAIDSKHLFLLLKESVKVAKPSCPRIGYKNIQCLERLQVNEQDKF